MADYLFFVSNLDESSTGEYENALVLEIKGASTAPKATLAVFPRKPNCNDNQLWETVDSGLQTLGGGPYYFFKSKSNGLVITANGSSLEMAAQKSPASDDQLFDLNYIKADGLGYRWYTLANKNNNVMSVKGSATKAGTPVELAAPNNTPNQLWFEQT